MTSMGQAFGCGQCLPCRVNRRRVWAHRIYLEALGHGDNTFVTLTYEDPPAGNSLQPKDVQDWLKRLRKKIHPKKVRYFLVGEYGDETERPHYHAALFGFAPCHHGVTSVNRRGFCCSRCDLVRDTWSKGHVFLGSLERRSANYIAGYVVKKMTDPTDARLSGRYPEFARMSNRPGIGAGLMWDLASVLLEHGLGKDVPHTLRHGDKQLPLGRYLMWKLRTYVGRIQTIPQEVFDEIQEELRPLFLDSIVNETSFAQEIAKKNAPYEAQLKARQKLQKNRKGTRI